MTAGWVSSLAEKCQRELDKEIPVVGEYALCRRSEVMGKVRVLTS
jgi:hypothetical protein